MQAATIVPQPFLHMIKDQSYHLALAHLIEKDGFDEYTEFYTHVGRDHTKFLILDNGLIEGDPRPIGELIDKAQRLSANELVLPDVFKDSEATLIATHKALKIFRDYAPGCIRIGAVAQGTSVEEVIECAKELLSFNIDTLYIPKVVTSFGSMHGRLEVLKNIQEDLHDRHVHLLGCWTTPLELKTIENYVRAGKIKPVRGVDSAIAYVHARANMTLIEDERPDSNPIDFKYGDKVDRVLLESNIAFWQEECESLPNNPDRLFQIKR